MKKILAIVLALGVNSVYANAVVQKVCHTDTKTKKEVCKTIKTHKKVEGTPVPDAPIKKK